MDLDQEQSSGAAPAATAAIDHSDSADLAAVMPWSSPAPSASANVGQGSSGEIPADRMYGKPSMTRTSPPVVESVQPPPSAPAQPIDAPIASSSSSPLALNSSISAAGDSRKEARGKRVLPARLRRVSALLGGDGLDEVNGASGRESTPLHRSLPDSTIIVISSRDQDAAQAFDAPLDEEGLDSLSFFQDPKMVMACREKALIETPDFKLRDDASQMGKTRGGALRSEEDTSDAAYERRHRRPDNLEKKQRRMEKERLIKDRQRLRDRIEQLKTADPRMLMPIIAARESQLPASSTAGNSFRGAEAAIGLGKQNMSVEAANNLNKIEQLRKELIAETKETLARYDAVLSLAVPVAESPAPGSSSGTASSGSTARNKANKAGSPSVSHKTRLSSSGTAATPPPRKPRAVSNAASPDSSESEVIIRAEKEHRNIHARTSGGRFAPRSAVIDPNDPEGGYKPARKPRPSELVKKAQKEAERQARAAGLLPPKKRNSSKGKAKAKIKSAASPETEGDEESEQAQETDPEVLEARAMNRTGPSLAELEAAERRPKRVRLLIGQRNKGEGSSGSSSGAEGDEDAQATAAAVNQPVAPRFTAPGALSLEQAQKMMAAAMAAARGGPSSSPAAAAPGGDEGAAGGSSNGTGAPAGFGQPSSGESSTGATVTATPDESGGSGSHEAVGQPTTATSGASAASESKSAREPDVGQTAGPADAPAGSAEQSKPNTIPASTSAVDPPRSSSTPTSTSSSPIKTPLAPRRTSNRVRGAFGEKLSQRAFQQEDFEFVLVREGVVSNDADEAVAKTEATTSGDQEAKVGAAREEVTGSKMELDVRQVPAHQQQPTREREVQDAMDLDDFLVSEGVTPSAAKAEAGALSLPDQ